MDNNELFMTLTLLKIHYSVFKDVPLSINPSDGGVS